MNLCVSFRFLFQVCMVVESMADGAVRMGMTRDMANRLAVQTVLGTAKLIRDKDIHPAVLRVGYLLLLNMEVFLQIAIYQVKINGTTPRFSFQTTHQVYNRTASKARFLKEDRGPAFLA